jgi:CxxC-x17-CxxC domain-containing protein
MIDGIAGNAFSAVTLPPLDSSKTETNAEKVIKVTRERYGTPRDIVEEKIARWSGMIPEKELAANMNRPNSFENNSENMKSNKPIKVYRDPPTENNPNIMNSNKPIKVFRDPPAENNPDIMKDNRPIKVFRDPPTESTKISEAVDDRPKYPAKCATCEVDIEVPFKPDASRPTFCKDCLKDYQRQQARLQGAKEQRGNGASDRNQNSPRAFQGRPEKTITMLEAARMNPKPFRQERERTVRKKVNLDEVRSLIKESLENKSKA